MKNIMKQPEQHKQTPWAMPDDGKIYIGKSTETFNENFKPNTELSKEFTLEQLEEILETLSNHETERGITILNWNETHQQLFHEAMQRECEKYKVGYDTTMWHVTNKLNQEIAKQHQESDRGNI